MRVWPGQPYPLGATWTGLGVNFAIYSANATRVELCLFSSPEATQPSACVPLSEHTDMVWHSDLPDARPGQLYAYRVHGPYEPAAGLRFNPHKFVIDPYAKAIGRSVRWDDSMFGYTVGSPDGDLSFDTRDNGAFAPLAGVIDPSFTWGDDRPPRTPWHKTVIYEMHVKGFTKMHRGIPDAMRGTYEALTTEPALEHLTRLGVTAVELMPVHHHAYERPLVDRGLSNYWGYNTLSFFAPDLRYSMAGTPDGVVQEFKRMVKALHSAGLEVILDVVYNHTAEGNHLGPTLSLRGVDNATYYRLMPDDRRHYLDFTGCGNTLNMQSPQVLQLIMDSLRYWVLEMHVDGFRFDLASALARELYEVDRLGAFFDIIHQDPVISQVKLIAEPWDLGAGGYQVGNFPLHWTEWNGQYRDAIRAFWKGDDRGVAEVATRIAGSNDLYEHSGRRPYASVNFITAHDGFTLHDLVSYNEKHNEANGEHNQDGEHHNLSWKLNASSWNGGRIPDRGLGFAEAADMWRDDPAAVRPMLATTGTAPLDSAELAYEPKYDGIRALASVIPTRRGVAVTFWSRLGNDKTAQFPEIADALERWGRTLDRPVLVDGELVALDDRGTPLGFQHLQRRHMTAPSTSSGPRVAYFLFDILRDGDDDLRPLSLTERRARLTALVTGGSDPRLQINEQVVADGREMQARAHAGGWEGLIAKRLDAPYTSGTRSPHWRKLKLVRRQACVIGGWTDPRGSRPFFGALLLGIHDDAGRLQYIGHTGAGFTDAELGRLWRTLRANAAKRSPFAKTPKTNAPPHWVEPTLVAEVKFTEWTADGKLRHPTYLGLREDITPESVRKEPDTTVRESGRPEGRPLQREAAGPGLQAGPRRDRAAARTKSPALSKTAVARLLDQIDAIQDGSGSGVLELPAGERLEITNLRKVFWPTLKLTKGDLFRHYVRVAPYILPVLADRPLVMKRYPNGVDAKPFYQHRAPDKVPPGVRVEHATTDTETRAHIIGGSLVTLLYTAQLASISQDPWLSRVQSEDIVDHVAIDLDPPDGLPFPRVLDVAQWVRDELDALKAPCYPKTSGAGGLHIYVAMPPGTSYQAGLLFCQIVATVVSRKHPKVATVERSLKARGRRVYVDYLQNSRGKTLASAYSARASEFAGMSTPLTWAEIEDGVSPRDFTIRTAADRLEAVGDVWAPLRRSKGPDLRAVMKYAEP